MVSHPRRPESTTMHDQVHPDTLSLTYEDFLQLPDDGRRYEILDGELFMSPAPRPIHQWVLLNLVTYVRDHVVVHDLGDVFIAPVDVLLSEHDIVEPDLVFIAKANEHIVGDTNIRGVPDLLGEVLSPSKPTYDTRDKLSVYARCGVPFYWWLDPDKRTLSELRLVDRAYQVVVELSANDEFRPTLFPGLEIPLKRIWMRRGRP